MSTNKPFELLTDSTASVSEDAFNHEVYADLLSEIFTPSPDTRGISVGLFGKWGQGKSSIVDMLGEHPPEKTKIIVFNAWQARGDCVRRQLFLEVLQAINPAEAEKMKQFAGLEVARELLQTEDDKRISSKRAKQKLWKSLREDKVLGLSAFVILLLLSIPFLSHAIFKTEINWSSTIVQIFILPVIFFLIKYVRETVISKYTGLLGVSEPISESQRLKYPEQFKELFVKHTALFCHEQGQEVLVVVDDLDRCEPETVVEALASIRQLKGPQTYIPKDGEKHYGRKLPMLCRFLVPCDEKQVVLALEADGHDAGDQGGRYHDYQSEELLRKFFDVIVRMDQLLPQDLTQYAAELAREIDITDLRAVRSLIHAVSPKDPRQVKKLINAFKTARRRVELSREKGFLPDKEDGLPELTNTLLAIVALRETYPCIYNDIIAPAPERLALLRDQKYDELGELEEITERSDPEQKRVKNSLRKAGKMLLRLPELHMSTAELLIHGQADPELRGVPRQGELHRSVLANNSQQFLEAIPESTEHRNQVFKWLNGKIESGNIPEKNQEHLAFILDYAKENPDGTSYATDALRHLLENTHYCAETLEPFERIDEFSEAVVDLTTEEKKLFWSHIELTTLLNGKAKLFFKVGNRLSPSEVEHLSDQLESILEGSKDEGVPSVENIIQQIWACLPDNRKCSSGLLPSVGQTILTTGWFSEKLDEETLTIQADVGLHFIGNAPEACYETLLKITENDAWEGVFTKATDSDDFYPAWHCATELLQRMEKEKIPEFFDYLHEHVLAQQSGDLIEYLYERLKPVLYAFTEDQLILMGSALGSLLAKNTEDWIFKLIGKPQDKAKWKALTQSCAERYLTLIEGNMPYTEEIGSTLEEIRKTQWDVTELVDAFLVEKFNHIANEIQLKKWADGCLKFLAGKRTPQTKEEIVSCITNQHWLDVSIHVGIKTCWRSSISRPDAELIATGLINSAVSDRTLRNLSYARLPKKRGAAHVFNTLITKINAYDISWQATNHDLLEYVARHISKASDKKSAFISTLESMLTSGQAPVILSALKVVNSFPKRERPLEKIIRELVKSDTTTEAIKTECVSLLKK